MTIKLNRQYHSQAFQDRIEVNLGNISSNPEDEFKLFNAFYDPKSFDCELCGHKYCNYAFVVQNIQTQKKIKVGSECIHHFKDRGVNIDLAEGLMKRVWKATKDARNELKDDLAKKAWDEMPETEKANIRSWEKWKVLEELGKTEMKKLSREDKAELTVKFYMVIQAKELLADVAQNKAILDEDQIKHIVEMGLSNELDAAQKRARRAATYKNMINAEIEFEKIINGLETSGFKPLDPVVVEQYDQKWVALYTEYYGTKPTFDKILSNRDRYQNEITQSTKMAWLASYQGPNPIVQDIKRYYFRKHYISTAQESYAKALIAKETV